MGLTTVDEVAHFSSHYTCRINGLAFLVSMIWVWLGWFSLWNTLSVWFLSVHCARESPLSHHYQRSRYTPPVLARFSFWLSCVISVTPRSGCQLCSTPTWPALHRSTGHKLFDQFQNRREPSSDKHSCTPYLAS